MAGRTEKTRCAWAGDSDPEYIRYHDMEWAVPVVDDQKLFEFLILEGAQAGLSWRTILQRREGYRKAFKDFDSKKVAKTSDADVERLMNDAAIIRNRLKITGAIKNAKAFIDVQKEHGSFAAYIWNFVDGKPVQNVWKRGSDVPAETELAKKISKDLKKRGFTFVGPTITYAFMQAVGMVNDHTVDCFRQSEVAKKRVKLP